MNSYRKHSRRVPVPSVKVFQRGSANTTILVLLAFLICSGAALAQNKTFTLNGATLSLRDASADLGVLFTSMHFNRAANVWNVDVSLTNQTTHPVQGPLVLLVDSFTGTTGPLQPDGVDETGKSFFDLTGIVLNGQLSPGARSQVRTLSLGVTSGSPALITRRFVAPATQPSAVGLTRTLDDGGQPLAGVQVIETGPLGILTNYSDTIFGVITVGQAPGLHTWRFFAAGYLPVWRQQVLTTNEVTIILDPRLARRSTNIFNLTPIAGGIVSNAAGTILISFGPGAFSQSTTGALTQLSGQTLPAFLPQGWSPLQSFSLELGAEPIQPGATALALFGPLGNGDAAALARWDAIGMRWQAMQIIAGSGTSNVNIMVPGSGVYTIVVADNAPSAPPAAQPGQPLLPSLATAPDPAMLGATGTVEPASSPASMVPELVTGIATVLVTNPAGPIASGLPLRGEVREQYSLTDHSMRHPPQYESFFIGYQRPAVGDGLQFSFPLRPMLLFGPDDLDQATVTMDVVPPLPFTGGVLDTNGGLIALDTLSILAGTGDLGNRQAVQLRKIDPTNFVDFQGAGNPVAVSNILAAFELSVAGVLPGHHLVAQFGPVPTNGSFVLARVRYDWGLYGLQPIERLVSDGLGHLSTAENFTGTSLSGIISAGQYLFLQLSSPQALLTGIARNSAGQPAAGLPVTIANQPWLAFSSGDGSYRLLAPTGTVQVAVTDLGTGDTGLSSVRVTNTQSAAAADVGVLVAGPSVISVTPTNGAASVSRVSPIIVTFSKPINPATLLGAGLQLLGSNSVPVPAGLSLNLKNTIATLLPTEQLDPSTLYTVAIATNVTDSAGRGLTGPGLFSFTTESDLLNRLTAQLVIFEPGATNIPADVLSKIPAFVPGQEKDAIVVQGSAGSVEPGKPVILANESSGETATVLSKSDGSFYGLIHGGEADFISATIVNANGTRNYLPVSRQLFDNGFVGLYQGGGILEAQSDGGPVQVIVQPGAIADKTKFKLDLLSTSDLLALTGGVLPVGGTLLGGGLKISAQGGSSLGPVDVSIPVTDAQLQQAGVTNGATPNHSVFAMVAPSTLQGDHVFMLLDKMVYENGRLVTHSPPFPGANYLLNPPNDQQEAMDTQNLILGAASPPTSTAGESAAISTLGVMPLLLATESQPVVFSGKVIEETYDSSGIITNARPVGGALVTIDPIGHSTFDQTRPGRLSPGAIYCMSSQNGFYAAMIPEPEFGDPTIPGSGQEFVLTAQHPTRFGVRTSVRASVQVSVARLTDIIFHVPGPGAVADPNPARLSMFHSPLIPAPGQQATITVLASHGSDLPVVTLSAIDTEPLVAGGFIPANAAQVLPPVITQLGATTVRAAFPVTCTTNARVTFKVRADVNGAPTASADYPVTFTDSPLTVTNPPFSDPNDHVGPRVVQSQPHDDPDFLEQSLRPGQPIVILFDEAVDASITNGQGIALSPAADLPVLELSPDQRTLTLTYYSLNPDTKYTLTLNSQITDISPIHNPLDQDPLTGGFDPFLLHFHTPPVPQGNLSEIQSGGGVVMRGIFAFALDRAGPLDGAVVAYNLSDPAHPLQVGQLQVPGFPRDLALIPKYRFAIDLSRQPSSIRTNNLLAVVGGKLGASSDEFGNLSGGFQYLWVVDISNPSNMVRLASAAVTFAPDTAITKVQWSPPYLAYEASGPDSQAIVLENLQSFILGSFLPPNQFGTNINMGVDKLGDGDYVDFAAGDQLPVPARILNLIAGEVERFGLFDTDQRINDFVWDSGQSYLGVVLTGGHVLDSTGQPVDVAPPAYQTLLQGEIVLDRSNASLTVTNGTPKRLFTLFGIGLPTGAGQIRLANLALVSVEPNTTGPSSLVVIDVTDPTQPKQLGTISIPQRHGLIQSIIQHEDGLLRVATSQDVLLLDPSKLTQPQPPTGPHPALVGTIYGAGGGARSFDGDLDGLNVVNIGGTHLVKQTAPLVQFVSFPNKMFGTNDTDLAFDPTTITNKPDKFQPVLQKAIPADILVPACLRTNPGPSTLSPPARQSHYYVMAFAPGSSGPTMDLSLESLNDAQYPLRNKGRGFLPVRAMSDKSLKAIDEQPVDNVDAPIQILPAYRLSADPTDPAYNVYLSKPIAFLACENPTPDELQNLTNELDRLIIWSGYFERAYLDYDQVADSTIGGGNSVIGPFAAQPDPTEKIMRPGTEALLPSIPGDYITGPNPPSPIGHATLPGSGGSITAHSGELRTDTVDFSLPSRRMPIIFKRSAGSQDLYDGPFGRGWDFNYNQRIIDLEALPSGGVCPVVLRGGNDDEIGTHRDLLFINGEGSVLVYKFAGTNAPDEFKNDPLAQQLQWLDKGLSFYLPPTGVFDMMVRFKDKKYGRLLPDGTQFWYTTQGRLNAIYNRYTNNAQVMRYNDRGELVRVQDLSVTTDRYLDIGHYRAKSEQSHLTALDKTTDNKKEVGRIYRLVDYTGGALGQGRDVQFFYTDKGELEHREGIKVTTANLLGFTGRPKVYYTYIVGPGTGQSQYPQANGLSGIVAGDPNGAPLISINEFMPGAPGPTAKNFTGANGPVSLDMQYGNTAADLAAGNGKIGVTTADSAQSQITLDKSGLPGQSRLSGPGSTPVTYRTLYYSNGLPAEIDYPMGNKVIYTYEFQFGTKNIRTQPNLRIVQTFPRDGTQPLTTQYSYENKYNLKNLTQIDVNNNSILYALTGDGLDVGQIQYPPVGINLPSGTPSIPVGLGATETFTYNEYGQLVLHQDVDGISHHFRLDRPDGFLSGSSIGNLGETTFTYGNPAGLVGKPDKSVPPLNAVTSYTYNEREELLSVNRNGLLSTFSYDENGRLVRQTSTADAGKELENIRIYEQNGFLRTNILNSAETGTGQGLQQLQTTYDHDAMFRVTKITYPNGESKIFDPAFIDHLGRPHQMKLGEYTESYGYDDNNNLLSITRGDAVTIYNYDGFDRLQTEILPVIGAQTETTMRSYFNNGAVKELTVSDPSGRIELHATYQVDALNRIAAETVDTDTGQATKAYSYDPSARLRQVASPAGEVTTIAYDEAGRSTSLSNSVQSVGFALDDNNNILNTSSHEGPSGRNVYTTHHDPFDALDRPTQLADDVGLIASYQLRRLDGKVLKLQDARGQIHQADYTRLGEPMLKKSPSGVEFHYAYDSDRRPTFEGDIQDQGWRYVYDSSLRLKQRQLRDGQTFSFDNFDARNQPRDMTFPGLAAHQEYDLQGRVSTRSATYANHVRSETNSFDSLDRPTATTFLTILGGSSLFGSLQFQYDLEGPLRREDMQLAGNNYSLVHDLRIDGVRTNLAYASGLRVAEGRDLHARLTNVQPAGLDAIVTSTEFEAANLVGRQTIGPGVILCENTFDLRKRLTGRKYTRVGDTNVLAELRYVYDPTDNVVARQFLSRGGRVDFFDYDPDNRLIRADFGARPTIGGAGARQVTGFTVPGDVAAQGGSWSPGFFGRNYQYDSQDLDLRTATTTDNPDGFALLPFAASVTNFDTDLLATSVDGFVRGRDTLGNTTNTVLQVRSPGAAAPVPVPATLQYDSRNELIQIVRRDGVQINYEYLPNGLCYYRKVSGPSGECVPSERVFIWDDHRLLEEYDLGATTPTLRARYYYAVSDVPIAADFADAGGNVERVYFLLDLQGSVIGVTDAQGRMIERYAYDAWGQPQIELADTRAPVIKRIITETNGLLIEFSERILPALSAGTSSGVLASSFADLASGIALQQGGANVPGTFFYLENRGGFNFGTVVLFQPAMALSNAVVLQLQHGIVNDEWVNPIAETNISFLYNPAPGTTLYQDSTVTTTSTAGRPFSDQPFLFHGQYYDFDAGLIYMRARFYDPFTGLFLQPDPAGYEQSVNPYAGFGNNPQSGRDPSGGFWHIVAGAAIGAAISAGIEAFQERHQAWTSGYDLRKIGAAAAEGAIAGGIGAATMGGSIAVGSARIGTELLGLGLGSGLAGMANRGILGQNAFSAKDIVSDGARGMLGGVLSGGAMKLAGSIAKPLLSAAGQAVKSSARAISGRFVPAAGLEVDEMASLFSIRSSGNAPSLNPPGTRAELQRLAQRGANLRGELEEFQRVGEQFGDIKVVEKFLSKIEPGKPVKLGVAHYEGGRRTTIYINSELNNRPGLANLRLLTLLHELSHARSAWEAGGRGKLAGFQAFIEEFGAHMDELALEVHINGVKSAYSSPLRDAFERGGRRGVADYLFEQPTYRAQFGASSYDELLSQQGWGFNF